MEQKLSPYRLKNLNSNESKIYQGKTLSKSIGKTPSFQSLDPKKLPFLMLELPADSNAQIFARDIPGLKSSSKTFFALSLNKSSKRVSMPSSAVIQNITMNGPAGI